MPVLSSVRATAPGQYLGYALQQIRLCHHLLDGTNSPHSKVSLELLDDVAIHQEDGSAILEQTKSATSQNPVADWARDLWKTLANWLHIIEDQRVNPATTTFRLYVTPQRTGIWVQRLSDARSDADADRVLADIAAALSALEIKPASAGNVRKLLRAPLGIQRAIVRNFVFESTGLDPVQSLKSLFAPALSDNAAERCCQYAIGLAVDQIDDLIRRREQPLISVGDFRAKVHAFIRRNDLSRLLISLAEQPSLGDVQALLRQAPRFVRQLQIIDASEDAKLRAVSDYLQSASDRTLWASEGEIVSDSLQDFDDGLVRQFAHIRDEIADTAYAADGRAKGRIVYNRCCQVRAPLEGREVPSHIIPGGYHALANELRVGWHPEFESLLDENG